MRRNRGQPAPFWGRLRAALAAGALAVVVGALAAAPTATAQPSSNQAGLVVLHGDGRVVTACVPFDEPEISGMALLQRSGLELNIDAGSGTGTVCRIDGEGCTVPQESCFCRCEGASCTYWSYWRTGAAGWDYSNLGAGSAVVRPGDVQGWVWGQGQAGDAAHPPALTLADICQAAAAETPTGTPSETPSETPSGTPTPVPSATAMPLSTSTPPPLSAPPRIELFVADRLNLAAGETVTLQWRVANAAAVLLHAGGQAAAVDAAGTAVLGPLSSVEVRLEASNTSGVVNSVLLLSVAAPPQAPAVPSPPAPPAAPARQVGAVQGPTPTLSAAATATATAGTAPVAQPPLLAQRIQLPLIIKAGALPAAEESSAAGAVAPPGSPAPLPAPPLLKSLSGEPMAAPLSSATPLPPARATAASGQPSSPTPAMTLFPPGSQALGATALPADGLAGSAWVALAALLLAPPGLGVALYLFWRLAKMAMGR